MHTRPPAGLLFALSPCSDAALPRAGIESGGIPIIVRQLRQLKALGVSEVVVLAAGRFTALEAPLRGEARRLGVELSWTTSAEGLYRLAREQALLAIDESLLIDDRLLEAFDAAAAARDFSTGPLLAQWSGKGGKPGGVVFLPADSLDPALLAAAGQRLPQDCRRLADLARGEAARFDFSGLDPYAPSRRRVVPMLWRYLDSAIDGQAGTTELLAAAQKGCLDWPARFIHPPIENALTRLLLPTPVTPNMLSLANFFAGLYAAWLFAEGQVWAALLMALVIGPLDGVDGKLARTRCEFSRWGDLEHIGDKIVEYLWYAGIAAWIGTAWAWAVAALIVGFSLAEALQGEIYRRLTGSQLDDAGMIERRFRLVSGRRNTFMWTLVPFGLASAWQAGFVVIAAYAVATFFFVQIRFFIRLSSQFREDPAAIQRNVARTAYGFMPEKPQPAE
jgi:phosphatidylglycerophosphate synthase